MLLVGKILGINTSDGQYNLNVLNQEGVVTNLKIGHELGASIRIGHVYSFEYESYENSERIVNNVINYSMIDSFDLVKKDDIYRSFYQKSPISLDDSIKEVYKYLDLIENKIIKDITLSLIEKYKDQFFIYPAASKMHHAYVGGLAHHSIGMLHFADGFIENYPYLNKDYIYAGIMLHDIGKAIELTGVANTEYTLKGQLLGHLVLGAMEIDSMAKELGYSNADEALMLEHMLISHHGQPIFGSAKKPMTAEALVLWYIDTIDSKFRVLGEELAKTESGSYTENIGVLDRQKMYKI